MCVRTVEDRQTDRVELGEKVRKAEEKEKNVALGRTGARAGGWRKQIKG